MDVSPHTLREVEFREKMRGYHPEDVDQFLERVAAGIEMLQDRLRQATERAQRAEETANDVGGSDETLRRTLVLAQRTADLAVQEAREQAARILASAEQQAHSVIGEAEERARRTHEDALAAVKGELSSLEASREQLQADVDNLSRWVREHRSHLKGHMQQAMAQIDSAELVSPPPVSHPLDLPVEAAEERPPSAGGDAELPSTMAWRPGDDEAGEVTGKPAGEVDPYFAQLRRAINEPDSADARALGSEGDESPTPLAHDQDAGRADTEPPGGDFFDQDSFDHDSFEEGPRFGGRLRRRRGG